jgi:UDPglucose 6-dehydrogenase
MNILVVGTGYVGLVTGTCFAEMGHNVTCLDINVKKIEDLHKGIIPIYEPGLKELVTRNVQSGRLHFTTEYELAVKASTVCFIAVNTPQGEDGSADLSYVIAASRQIAEHMDSYRTIVMKSTVPVGTCRQVKHAMRETFNEKELDIEFDIVSNPEFLKEGDAINDFMKPDRIIIGADNDRAATIMKEIYSGFTLNRERIQIMDTTSSEMTKYASNAMLATRISFMNELSGLCEHTGANINNVRKGMAADTRIGPHFLYAGAGYGGSCFPKDVQALCAMGRCYNYSMPVIDAAEEVNRRQKRRMGEKVIEYYSQRGGLAGKTFAIWGCAFKPNTDDMRESPALVLIEMLTKEGASFRVYDPVAMPNAKEILKDYDNITWCGNEYETASYADAVILMTEWKQFRFINFHSISEQMSGSVFFDGRNQYRPHEMATKGFDYISIGRETAYAPTKVRKLEPALS